MEIHAYGIVLRRITEGDLEQVRIWRNAPHVRANMEFQAEITPEAHLNWFQNLDPAWDFYFIASEKGVDFAVLHVKKIDGVEKAGEAGIFVGNPDYLLHPSPIKAILAMNDYFFEEMGYEYLEAKVKLTSAANVELNRQLGYEAIGEGGEFQRYRLWPERYYGATRRLRNSQKQSERGFGEI